MNRFRYIYLLSALALVVFARPFVTTVVPGVAAVDVLLYLTLFAGAYAAIDRLHRFIVLLALGLFSLAAQIAMDLTGSNPIGILFLVTALCFYTAVSWALLATLFEKQKYVSRDTLYQAFSVYLLFGLIGTMAYALLESLSPGSFLFNGYPSQEVARYDRFLGFSFTTLTTLGYGNVAPATPRADAIATLQAVAGQIYIAIVIARLVAIQVGQQQHQNYEFDRHPPNSKA